MSRVVEGLFALLLAGLVLLASRGELLLTVGALCFAVLLAAVCVAGSQRIGTLAILGAMLLAPMDAVRPGSALLTFSDLAFGLGFLLLAPVILRTRAKIPAGFTVGATVILCAAFVSALLSAAPVGHFALFARLLAAVILLPLAIGWWGPSTRLVEWMAAAYVAGQCISTAYAAVGGGLVAGGRSFGLTAHPNFLGLGSTVAIALCLFLYTRTHGWVRVPLWGAAALCSYGIVLSGSRAALMAVVVMALLFPLLERSLVSAYMLVVGGLTVGVSLTWLVEILGPTSALARLMPGDFGAGLSNQAREIALEIYWGRFLEHPVFGEGFTADQYLAHNVLLQFGVALGVFGTIGFLVLMWSLARPLFNRSLPLRGLSYLAIAYATVAPFTPSIWDRNIWAGLGLAILAGSRTAGDTPTTDDAADQAPAAVAHTKGAM